MSTIRHPLRLRYGPVACPVAGRIHGGGKGIDPLFPTITPTMPETQLPVAIGVGASVKSVQTVLRNKSAFMTLDAVAIAVDRRLANYSFPLHNDEE